MAKNIVELNIDNTTYNCRPYVECMTAAGTAAKTVDYNGFTLFTGATVLVKFTNGNSASSPTLNVNGTGDKFIKWNGSNITSSNIIKSYAVYELVYDNNCWMLLGGVDTNTTYTLPIASSTTLGGIKVGTNLSINASTGVLSATDTQSDWNETDSTSAAYIKNKPTIPSIPSVGNGKITIKQNGEEKGSFTVNQTGDTTIELTDNTGSTSTGEMNVQSDWNVTDTTSDAFIKNKPGLVTTAGDGLVPKADAAAGTINSSSTDWVLTNDNGTIGWYKLPANAFSNTNTVTPQAIGVCAALADNAVKNMAFSQSIGTWYNIGNIIYLKFTNGNTAVGTTDKPFILTDSRGSTILNVLYKNLPITESNPFNISPGTVVCFAVTQSTTSSSSPGTAEVIGIYDEYSLPTATSTTLGGVKVGSTLSIEDGVLNMHMNKKVTIDASGLDENKWYPVTFKLPYKKIVKLACIVSLDSGTNPSWASHEGGGFSTFKVWESIGSQWGVHLNNHRIIYASKFTWVKAEADGNKYDPVRGVGQLANSSTEYVYVRGGGKYYFYSEDSSVTITLRTENYTVSEQTLEIKTMDNVPAAMIDFDSQMVKHPYNTSVGNSSTPVYINQYGNAVACSSISSSGTKVTNSGSTGKWYYPIHVDGLDETTSYTNYVNSGFTVFTRNGTTSSTGDVTLVIGSAATGDVKVQKGYLKLYGDSGSATLYGPGTIPANSTGVYLPSEAGTLVVKNSSGTASCNISGSSGSCTGNAATATTATNANNININTSTASYYYPMTFVTSVGKGNKGLYIDGGTAGTSSTAIGVRYNPSAKTCYCSGGFYEASDERLKNFSNDIEVDLDKLSKLSKKYFTWKDDESNIQHIGVSAQEVQTIYPELVEVIDEEGHLSVSYDKLSVVALKGIDILNDKIKSLEERIERLEKLINC